MRAGPLPIGLAAILVVGGTASGGLGLGYPENDLVYDLQIRIRALEDAPGNGARAEVLRRSLHRLRKGYPGGSPVARARALDRAAATLRRRFPEDEDLDGLLRWVEESFAEAVREDREGVAASAALLPEDGRKVEALLQLAGVDRALEDSALHPDRPVRPLALALRRIRRLEETITGGGPSYFQMRIEGHRPYEPVAMDGIVGVPPGGFDHFGLFTAEVVTGDGRRIWYDGPGRRVRFYMPLSSQPGTIAFGPEGPSVSLDIERRDRPVPEQSRVHYCSDDGNSPSARPASGTLVLRSWIPATGVIDGSFSCVLYLRDATGIYEGAEEEIRVEGEFRFTGIR